MKKNLLFLCTGLIVGAAATALAVRLYTRTDTVFWSKEDMTVVLVIGTRIRMDADTAINASRASHSQGHELQCEGVGHPSEARFLKLILAVPTEEVAGLFHQGRVEGGNLLTDMEMIYEQRSGDRVDVH